MVFCHTFCITFHLNRYKIVFVPFHSKVENLNGDNEKFWDAMLDADRRDYERICSEYNVTDLQMILRKLEEKKNAREQKKNQVWKLTVLTQVGSFSVKSDEGC